MSEIDEELENAIEDEIFLLKENLFYIALKENYCYIETEIDIFERRLKALIKHYLYVPMEWENYQDEPLYIVEGVPDALTLQTIGFNVIGLRSKTINKQAEKELQDFINETAPSEIIIIPDADALDNWNERFKKILQNPIVINLKNYDKNLKFKDINDLYTTILKCNKEKFKDTLKNLIDETKEHSFFVGRDELKKIVENFREEISTTDQQISGVTISKTSDRIIIKKNRKYLNLFSGYSIEFDKDKKVYKKDIENNHIYRVIKALMKHNPVYIDYLCKFFAYNLFNDNDERKAGKIIVLHSMKQGIGKGSLMKFFETILNDHYVMVDQNELEGNFNSYLERALVCFFDEVELSRETYDKKIKTLATSDKIRINEKGVKQYTKLNNTMYIVATNSRNSAKITKEDRRAVMFDCGTELKGNFPFWQDFLENLEENSKEFFLYLKTLYDESDKNELYFELERGLMTDYKQEVINMNLDSVEAFMNDLVNDYEYKDWLLENLEEKNGKYYIVANDIFKQYKTYCEETGKRQQGKNRFFVSLNNEYYSMFDNDCYSPNSNHVVWLSLGAKNVMDFTALFEYLKNKVDATNIEEKEASCKDAYFNKKYDAGDKILRYIEDYYHRECNTSEGISRINELTDKIKQIKARHKQTTS